MARSPERGDGRTVAGTHLSRALAALVLAAAPALGGCAGVANYFRDRAGDLSDAVQIAVGGPAFGVHVEGTVLANTGLDVWLAYGERGGEFGNFAQRMPGFSPYLAYSALVFHARGADTDPRAPDPAGDRHARPAHGGFPTHAFEIGRPFDGLPYAENLRPLRWLDVEVDAALLAGVRVRVSPGELLDFVLGIFGADLAMDDHWEHGVEEGDGASSEEPAAVRADVPEAGAVEP